MTIDREPAFERAMALSLKLLAHRARSESEIHRRLQRAGFAPEVTETTVARLKELRYLDDAAYARSRAQTLLSRGRFAPKMVEQRLAAVGVPEQTALAAVREARGERDERELARSCLATRRPALGLEATRLEKVRAARFLSARGFSEEVAREVVGLPEDPALE